MSGGVGNRSTASVVILDAEVADEIVYLADGIIEGGGEDEDAFCADTGFKEMADLIEGGGEFGDGVGIGGDVDGGFRVFGDLVFGVCEESCGECGFSGSAADGFPVRGGGETRNDSFGFADHRCCVDEVLQEGLFVCKRIDDSVEVKGVDGNFWRGEGRCCDGICCVLVGEAVLIKGLSVGRMDCGKYGDFSGFGGDEIKCGTVLFQGGDEIPEIGYGSRGELRCTKEVSHAGTQGFFGEQTADEEVLLSGREQMEIGIGLAADVKCEITRGGDVIGEDEVVAGESEEADGFGCDVFGGEEKPGSEGVGFGRGPVGFEGFREEGAGEGVSDGVGFGSGHGYRVVGGLQDLKVTGSTGRF